VCGLADACWFLDSLEQECIQSADVESVHTLHENMYICLDVNMQFHT
jgi:hypothetical protein